MRAINERLNMETDQEVFLRSRFIVEQLWHDGMVSSVVDTPIRQCDSKIEDSYPHQASLTIQVLPSVVAMELPRMKARYRNNN